MSHHETYSVDIAGIKRDRIFLGQRAYGVGAAARVYFDKAPRELTLAGAALSAGLPRAPSLDNPVASVERARERRAYVLRRMQETGKGSTRRRASGRPRSRSSRACTDR